MKIIPAKAPHLLLAILCIVLALIPAAHAFGAEPPVFVAGDAYRGTSMYCLVMEDADAVANTIVTGDEKALRALFTTSATKPESCRYDTIVFIPVRTAHPHRQGAVAMNVLEVMLVDGRGTETKAYLLTPSVVFPPVDYRT